MCPGTCYLFLFICLSSETDWPLRWVLPQAGTPPFQLQGVDQISKHVVCVTAFLSPRTGSMCGCWLRRLILRLHPKASNSETGALGWEALWPLLHPPGHTQSGPGSVLAEWRIFLQLANKTTLLAKGNAGHCWLRRSPRFPRHTTWEKPRGAIWI